MRSIFSRDTVVSFELVKLRTSGMRFTAEYEIVMKSGAAEVSQYQIRYTQSKDERILDKRASVSEETVLKLLNDCRILSWDGFSGAHPRGVRDGTMFGFEAIVNGGRVIKASGSENFPKCYREFMNGINQILNSEKE